MLNNILLNSGIGVVVMDVNFIFECINIIYNNIVLLCSITGNLGLATIFFSSDQCIKKIVNGVERLV